MSDSRRAECVAHIAAAPRRLRAAVTGLDDAQLDTPYRPGGWTVRQVVHHVPDSHLNAYVRMKLALTEDTPAISLRGGALGRAARRARLRSRCRSRCSRRCTRAGCPCSKAWAPPTARAQLRHPEHGRLDDSTILTWHGDHHTAHVTGLRERMGWS